MLSRPPKRSIGLRKRNFTTAAADVGEFDAALDDVLNWRVRLLVTVQFAFVRFFEGAVELPDCFWW